MTTLIKTEKDIDWNWIMKLDVDRVIKKKDYQQ